MPAVSIIMLMALDDGWQLYKILSYFAALQLHDEDNLQTLLFMK